MTYPGILRANLEDPTTLPSHYHYESLPSESSFRILELLPGHIDWPLAYSLHDADWEVPTHPYEAVSYAWGDASNKVPSSCNGRRLLITHSLRDALVAMRYPKRPRFLWVDAICIDQTNNDERGRQVSHMRTIYQNATRVLVWLGKDECGLGARGIKAMQEIARQCSLQETPEPWPEKTKMKDVQELWDLLPKHMLQDPCLDTPENWTALSWFFSRSWFSRLWIIQEVNVNKEVQMLCGSTQVSWDVAVLAASYIKQHSRIHRRWGFPASHFNNAYYMRRRFWLQKVALPSLLNWGRSFNASDPMDRVYALMGMPSFNQIRHLLTVDYSKPKVDLYTDIATICICEMGGLRILCYAQHLEEGSEFPSWVPQWDRPERYRAIQDSLTKVRWNPSGGRELEASVDPRLRCLKSKGIIFDTIKSVCPLGKTMSLLDESSDHPVISFWEAQNRKPTTYPTGEGSLDVLASVIATGLDKNLRKASANIDSFKQDFAAYLNRLLCISGRDQHAYRQIAKAEEQGDWFGYESLVQSTCQYRSLVFTEMGYMGLGPNCQVGDLVCILFGGEVPFVLRPSEGYYRLVGDVYIHGIMEGEAMGLHGNEKSPAMIFDIR